MITTLKNKVTKLSDMDDKPEYPVVVFLDDEVPNLYPSLLEVAVNVEQHCLPDSFVVDSQGRIFEIVNVPEVTWWDKLDAWLGEQRPYMIIPSTRVVEEKYFIAAKRAFSCDKLLRRFPWIAKQLDFEYRITGDVPAEVRKYILDHGLTFNSD